MAWSVILFLGWFFFTQHYLVSVAARNFPFVFNLLLYSFCQNSVKHTTHKFWAFESTLKLCGWMDVKLRSDWELPWAWFILQMLLEYLLTWSSKFRSRWRAWISPPASWAVWGCWCRPHSSEMAAQSRSLSSDRLGLSPRILGCRYLPPLIVLLAFSLTCPFWTPPRPPFLHITQLSPNRPLAFGAVEIALWGQQAHLPRYNGCNLKVTGLSYLFLFLILKGSLPDRNASLGPLLIFFYLTSCWDLESPRACGFPVLGSGNNSISEAALTGLFCKRMLAIAAHQEPLGHYGLSELYGEQMRKSGI